MILSPAQAGRRVNISEQHISEPSQETEIFPIVEDCCSTLQTTIKSIQTCKINLNQTGERVNILPFRKMTSPDVKYLSNLQNMNESLQHRL